MKNKSSKITAYELLRQKDLLSEAQFNELEAYRARGFFSVRYEIRFLVFLAVSLFTTGSGIFIYTHINSVGHISLLAIIALAAIACYYFSFKSAQGFSKQQQASAGTVHDYLELGANLLGGLFIGYLQAQFSLFGEHTDMATLLTTLLYFYGAYYFDNRAVLSLAITGLCAFAGFTASPSGILHNPFQSHYMLAYYGIAIALLLALWTIVAEKKNIKRHFNPTYLGFSLHIFAIACLSLLTDERFLLAFLILISGMFYFYKLAFKTHNLHYLVVAFLYAFIGLSIVLGQLLLKSDGVFLLMYASPFYLALAIYCFIKVLKKFKTANDSLY